MTTFLRAILQVGIFVVCAQTIVHFRPNGSYEKYLKILVSLMILIQIFRPLLRLAGGNGESLEERIAFFQEEMWGDMEQAGVIAERADRILNQMTLEEIRKSLEEGSGPGSVADGSGSGSGAAAADDAGIGSEAAADDAGSGSGVVAADGSGSGPETAAADQAESGPVQIEKIQVELGTEAEKRGQTE